MKNLSSTNRSKKMPSGKSDDLESKGFVEKSMEQDREKKLDMLANSVTAIKNISKTLGG